MCNITKVHFTFLPMFFIFLFFFFFFFFLKKRNSITIKSMKLNLCMWKCINMYWGIEVFFFVNPCSLCTTDRYLSQQCIMNDEQNSATMVTMNLKVSMCRDIIANSNITKAYFINPCDSCNILLTLVILVNTPLNAIHVHIYSDYVIHFECTCIVHTFYVYS